MCVQTIKKDKNNNNIETTIQNSPNFSSSSSIFEDINFSALFNPNDKYINFGEKTSYNLMSYDLGIFSSLSSICKNLNIPNDETISNNNSSLKLISNKKENDENMNENIKNDNSNNKELILSDSILKILLSENDSGIKKNEQKETTIKKLNKSEFTLNEEDLDELLKD